MVPHFFGSGIFEFPTKLSFHVNIGYHGTGKLPVLFLDTNTDHQYNLSMLCHFANRRNIFACIITMALIVISFVTRRFSLCLL